MDEMALWKLRARTAERALRRIDRVEVAEPSRDTGDFDDSDGDENYGYQEGQHYAQLDRSNIAHAALLVCRAAGLRQASAPVQEHLRALRLSGRAGGCYGWRGV